MSNLMWTWKQIVLSKGYFILLTVLMVVETAANLSSIGIQKFIIDDVFGTGLYDKLPLILGLFAALVMLDSVLFTVVNMILSKFKGMLRYQYIADFMNHFYTLPQSVYKNEKSMKILQLITKEVDIISNMIGQRIPEGIQMIVRTVILIVTVGVVSPFSLLLIFIICPFYMILGKYFTKKLKLTAKEKNESRAAWLSHMEEGVSSTREIIAYDRQKWEQEKFTGLFNRYFFKVREEGHLSNRQMVFMGKIKWLANLLMLAFLGFEVMQQTLSLGTFLVVYQFSTQLIDSINRSYEFIVGLSSSFASVERYREAVSIEVEEPGTIRMAEPIRSIRFENVNFRYYDETPFVLQGVSMSLPVGKKIAFVGTSGSGKSTIVQLLVRFYKPSEGSIVINQTPIHHIVRGDWTDKVRVVFQEPYLFPDTIRNNITFGCNLPEEALIQACKMAHIYDTIEALREGFDSIVGERGITLSGGQRQRVAIARALLANPEILIMDEATSALDVETERLVQHNIDRSRAGRTTIVIAHRLSTIENADIIYVLDQGTIVEHGMFHELLATGPVFKQLVQSQKYAEQGA